MPGRDDRPRRRAGRRRLREQFPTSPSGPGVSVAGNWTGTWQFVTAGATVTDDVTASLSESGSTVSGTWSSRSGAAGAIPFTAGSSIAGTLTISQTLLSGLNCSATSSLSGTASATAIMFTTANIPPSGLCQWGESAKFVLNKS